MSRKNRRDIFNPNEVGIYHCIQRTVRRAFLCGYDQITGKSFDHRRMWIQEQMQALCAIFAFDCLSYAIMSNHLHSVLRNRPDILETWSDHDVAVRWWQLTNSRRDPSVRDDHPTEKQLKSSLEPVRNQQLRARLGSISWFMRYLAEPIARTANAEDECTGRFWEGRFKSQKIVDEQALLACSVYVDLNPVRAGIAKTVEESMFTSAYQRIVALRSTDIKSPQIISNTQHSTAQTSASTRNVDAAYDGHETLGLVKSRADDWLAPIFVDISAVAYAGPMPSSTPQRASDKGFLTMSPVTYLALLRWTAQRIGKDASTEIPSLIAPVLDRNGLTPETWCDLITRFGKIFKQAAGTPQALSEEAARRGQRWMQTNQSPLNNIAC